MYIVSSNLIALFDPETTWKIQRNEIIAKKRRGNLLGPPSCHNRIRLSSIIWCSDPVDMRCLSSISIVAVYRSPYSPLSMRHLHSPDSARPFQVSSFRLRAHDVNNTNYVHTLFTVSRENGASRRGHEWVSVSQINGAKENRKQENLISSNRKQRDPRKKCLFFTFLHTSMHTRQHTGVRCSSSNSIKVASKQQKQTKTKKLENARIRQRHIDRISNTTGSIVCTNWIWKEKDTIATLKAYLFVCNGIWFIRCSTCSRITSTTQTVLRHQRSAHIQVELEIAKCWTMEID